MKPAMLRCLCAASIFLIATAASATSLLPNGKQTFLNTNGQPLSGGTVQFYVPNTTTPKDTWQDSGQTVLNTNPVVLDNAGRAIIYGSGAYREVVRDQYGNLIWDQVTLDTSASSSSYAGVSGGTANAQTVNAPSFTQTDGQTITFIPSLTSTGPFSIVPNGGSPIGVVKDTSSGPQNTTGGEIVAGNAVSLQYDAGRGAFHLSFIPPVPGAPAQITAGATTDIGTIGSHNVSIQGSATISSFGTTATVGAPFYIIQFAGSDTLVNSASLATPTGQTATTQAGDTATALYLGNSNWRILNLSSSSAPSGEVAAFASTSCPAGWIAANGTSGTVDARGVAIRGIDNGRGQDPDGTRTPGALQADAFQGHQFNYSQTQNDNSGAAPGSQLANNGVLTSSTGAPIPLSGYGTPRIATETRMANVALLYCQKL